ncbi:hypothetical protein KY339_04570 [Candidatus Woesearchaeota archaeon]|nr:hypothetical protein [Candidatus Woesearchaeota archaeon]
MSKGKILSLTNTDEVMWYRLSPEDKTLHSLDLIFDIYDSLYESDPKKIHSYSFHTKSGEMYFQKEDEDFIAYFIFTKTNAHIILRKTLNWEKYNKEINKSFEFVK